MPKRHGSPRQVKAFSSSGRSNTKVFLFEPEQDASEITNQKSEINGSNHIDNSLNKSASGLTTQQRAVNLQECVDYLDKYGVNVQGISGKDLAEGNVKSTLMLMKNIREQYSHEYGQRERADGSAHGARGAKHPTHGGGFYQDELHRGYYQSNTTMNKPDAYTKVGYNGFSGSSNIGSQQYNGQLSSSLLPGTIPASEDSLTHKRTPPPPLALSTELDHGGSQHGRPLDTKRSYLGNLVRPRSAPQKTSVFNNTVRSLSGSDNYASIKSDRNQSKSQPSSPVKQPTQAWTVQSTTPAIKEAVSNVVEQHVLNNQSGGCSGLDLPARPPKTPPVVPRRGAINKGYLHDDGEILHVPPPKPRHGETDWSSTNAQDSRTSEYVPSHPSDRVSIGNSIHRASSSQPTHHTQASLPPHKYTTNLHNVKTNGYHQPTSSNINHSVSGSINSYVPPSTNNQQRGPQTATSHPPKYKPPPEYNVQTNGEFNSNNVRENTGDLRSACSRLYNRDIPSSPAHQRRTTSYTTAPYTITSYTTVASHPTTTTSASSHPINSAYRPHYTTQSQSPRIPPKKYNASTLHTQERSSPMGQSSSQSASNSPGSLVVSHKPQLSVGDFSKYGGSASSIPSTVPAGNRNSQGEMNNRPPIAPPVSMQANRNSISSQNQLQIQNTGNSFVDNMTKYSAVNTSNNTNSNGTTNKPYVSSSFDAAQQPERPSGPAESLIRHQKQRSSSGVDRNSLGNMSSGRTTPSDGFTSLHSDQKLNPSLETQSNVNFTQRKPYIDSPSRLSIAASIGSNNDFNGISYKLSDTSKINDNGENSRSLINHVNNKWPTPTTPTTTTSGVCSGLDGLDNDRFDDSVDSATTPPLPALSPSNTPPITPPESPSLLHRQLQQQKPLGKGGWNVDVSSLNTASSMINSRSIKPQYLTTQSTTGMIVPPTTVKKKPPRRQVSYNTGKIWERRGQPPRVVNRSINPAKGRASRGYNGLNNVMENNDRGNEVTAAVESSFSDTDDYVESPYASEAASQKELKIMKRQMNELEGMYVEVMRMMGADRGSSEYGAPGSRRSISSTSSISRSRGGIRSRHGHTHRHRSAEYKQINKRFQRLESHVVTLARSVAHLSSELRSQNTLYQEIDSMKHEITQLKESAATSSGRIFGGKEFDRFRGWVPALTNPKRVEKLTKFFGQEPPWLHIFLRKLGYEKYIDNFEMEKIGMLELPYLSEERLQKIGIPMGPRLRILQEAQLCFRQENFNIYIV